MRKTSRALTAAAIAASAFATSACAPESPASVSTTVTVVTHDSFDISASVLAEFEAESGLRVVFTAPGDAGTLVNQLVLTKDSPLGDVVYGIDNTYASRAVEAGVIAPYEPTSLAAADGASYAFAGTEGLAAVDFSDVCVNADITWFAERDLAIPQTLGDLAAPEYAGLLSVPNPATSSPGLAFLLATVAAKGDGWPAYWQDLAANDVRITASWSDTYFVDFSAPNYGGDYPLVLSYASSPPFEAVDGVSPTTAILGTCFRQVEYVGLLRGGDNPAGGKAVIEWMLSDAFQNDVATSMYVYPVSTSVSVPEDWALLAPLSQAPWTLEPAVIAQNRAWTLEPAVIAQNRAAYLAEWTSIVID